MYFLKFLESVTLIDIRGNTKADLKLPMVLTRDHKISQEILEYFNKGKEILVTILYSMVMEKLIDFKIV